MKKTKSKHFVNLCKYDKIIKRGEYEKRLSAREA